MADPAVIEPPLALSEVARTWNCHSWLFIIRGNLLKRGCSHNRVPTNHPILIIIGNTPICFWEHPILRNTQINLSQWQSAWQPLEVAARSRSHLQQRTTVAIPSYPNINRLNSREVIPYPQPAILGEF